MLEEAKKRGATVIRGTAIKALRTEEGGVRGITIRRVDETTEDIEAEVVLDCSGMATFLANQSVTGPKYVGSYDKQIAFFAHVKGALRDRGTSGEMAKDNTLIFCKKKFHWSWFIPVDKEVVSIGLVVPTAEFVSHKQTPDEFFRSYLPSIHPDLARRTEDIEFVEEVHVIPNYSVPSARLLRERLRLLGRRASLYRSDFFLRVIREHARGGICRSAHRLLPQGGAPR